VIRVLVGRNQITLGEAQTIAEAGSTVFIPAGAAHGQKNVGDDPVHIRAIFPGTSIEIEMLERNPAPGGGRPAEARVYDARTGEVRVA